ncbi:MAG TPA: hypothetical protein VFJ16_19300 [Longimicrobium sp.]|nr:hypothetical protein [Longimicrobium sp.]
MDRDEPAAASVEALVRRVAAIPAGTTEFELFVPGELTWQGWSVHHDRAMTMVLHALLAKGLFPDGFEERPTGRIYRYKAG